jgi:hypothetical protein
MLLEQMLLEQMLLEQMLLEQMLLEQMLLEQILSIFEFFSFLVTNRGPESEPPPPPVKKPGVNVTKLFSFCC